MRIRIATKVAAIAALAMAAHPLHAACPADTNGDELVDVLDLLVVLGDWGACPGCPSDTNGDGVVDVLDLLEVLKGWGGHCPELAGKPIASFPFFQYVKAVNQGDPVYVTLNVNRHPDVIGETCDIYLVEAKDAADWTTGTPLTDVTGGFQTETFAANPADNIFLISGSDTLSGDADLGLGVPFDVVLDFDQNGQYDRGVDYIDGLDKTDVPPYFDRVSEHGVYVVHDVTQPGPLGVTEATYSCPNWDGTSGFSGQNLFYPKLIDDLGELPLVIVSHGNGHNYQWYDHLGFHLASYGYIVMSHANNTVPGVFTASTTTLEHTDIFLRELPNIQSGKLVGHIDTSRITWIGHSRGGEGVVIAYHRAFTGAWTPSYFDIANVRLVSSIAPVDFLRLPQTDPHGVNYHLWTGSADADVNGCANCNLCQTYHLHDRAEGYRQSITLQGAGHGDFHNGGGSSVASGPCLIGRSNTHKVMKGQVLPLIKRYIEGNVPAKDFFTRQWEDFKPIGAPTGDCIVNQLMYRDGTEQAGNFMVDDFQTESATGTSSSGGNVTFTVSALWEGLNDDQDSAFTNSSFDEMNGNTLGGVGDFTRGVVFEWNNDAYYQQAIVPAARDIRGYEFLSFRAAQATRHPNTIAELGDLTFTVRLRDADGTESFINIGAYGGGIEEPYQRTGCGVGAGWHNEFETIRLRLTDFQNNAPDLDLSQIVNVRLLFGPSWGSDEGRLNLDTIEFTTD